MLPGGPVEKLATLTNRQLEVLRLFCDGTDYKTIAKRLYIHKNTVKSHMGHIYKKLGLDLLQDTQRWRALYQEFCPKLQELEGRIEPSEISEVMEEPEEPEPVPAHIIRMVEEDERAIIPMPSREIIDLRPSPPPIQRQPSRRRWLLFGMLLGSILTVCAIFAAWEAYGWILTQLGLEEPTPISQASEVPIEQPSEVVIVPTATSAPSLSTVPVTQEVIIDTATLSPVTQTPALSLPSEPIILFEDDFDGGLSLYWQVESGSPIVVNGMLTTDQETWMVVGDPSWMDYVVEFDADSSICWINSRYDALAVRMIDLNNMIAWRWGDCESFWYVVENGVWNEVPNSKSQPGYGMLKIKISIEGNQFSVYVGDQLLSSFISDKYQQGKVGLRLDRETLIDNFTIKEELK